MPHSPASNNQPEPLWGGSRLVAWLKEGGNQQWPSPLLGTGRAMAFDFSLWLQERLPPLPPMPDDPVFILGMWRSGTTFAHELLASLDGTTAPESWECFRPSALRLLAPPRASPGTARPMDDAIISATSPQEDEFALLLLGEASVYRGFLDPRRLPSLQILLDQADDASWIAAFEAFMRAVHERRPGRLIIKSPNHLFRINSIARQYPKAAFLVMLRSPTAIYWSNVRMWQAMTRLYGHWPVPEGVIEDFVVAAMKAAAPHLNSLQKLREQGIPVVACRFESLIAAPAETVGALLPSLRIDSIDGAMAALRAKADALHASPRTSTTPLPPAAAAAGLLLDNAQLQLETSG